jgi:ADP-ribose pyrophosphatase YjhB (NUDIX family)
MNLMIRPTSILIEDDRMLLVKQYVTSKRGWSMPGGRLEPDETIEQCLIREMKEETGLDTKVNELLYVTDRFSGPDNHVVHLTFLMERTGEKPDNNAWTHFDPHTSKTSKSLREIRMVPFDELASCGFPDKFIQLVKSGFPGKGSYRGDFNAFYGE